MVVMKIYHLLHENQWRQTKGMDFYAPSSLEKEGFIHCSTKDQILATANRRYLGSTDLLVLVINPEKVTAKIVYEDLRGSGEKHPHIYGKLPIAAVESVTPIKPGEDGRFTHLPPEVLDK